MRLISQFNLQLVLLEMSFWFFQHKAAEPGIIFDSDTYWCKQRKKISVWKSESL